MLDPIIRTHYIHISKDVGSLDYFSKPKVEREQKDYTIITNLMH